MLNPCEYVFDLDNSEDVDRLIDLLWTGDVGRLLHRAVEDNPQLGNTYVPTATRRGIYEFHRSNLLAVAPFHSCTDAVAQVHDAHHLLSLKAYKTEADATLLDAIGCFFNGTLGEMCSKMCAAELSFPRHTHVKVAVCA